MAAQTPGAPGRAAVLDRPPPPERALAPALNARKLRQAVQLEAAALPQALRLGAEAYRAKLPRSSASIAHCATRRCRSSERRWR